MKKNISILFMMVFSLCIMAQEKTVIERFDDGSIKSVRFSPTDKAIPSNATEFFSKILNKRATDDFVLNRSKKASNDMSFERYQQYYKGVKVEDGHYNFRYKRGQMKVVTGHYVDVSGINPVPSITEDEAINYYLSYLGISAEEVWQSSTKLFIKEVPQVETSTKNTKAALVYCVNVIDKKIEDIGYIDAHTGELIYVEKSILL